jgi:hypothetical protein
VREKGGSAALDLRMKGGYRIGDETAALMKEYEGVGVDVKPLPIQQALVKAAAARVRRKAGEVPDQRQPHRPIVGGLSIALSNEFFVGTLGCFLRRVTAGTH